MDGHFYLDHLGSPTFRIFHMLLEICKCMGLFECLEFAVTWRSR